jgi:hypothetical protein
LVRLQAQENTPRLNAMRAVVAAVVEGRAPLANMEDAVRLLAGCRDLDEVRQIRDLAEAARLYARAVDLGKEAANNATEIKIRAECRAGEILDEMPKQGPGEYKRLQPATVCPSYEDLGIEKTQAHRWQQMSRVPEMRREAYIEQTKSAGRDLSSAGVYNLAVREAKASNGWPSPVPRPVSVFDSDQQALSTLLLINLAEPGRIVDVTYNEGVMWRGVPFTPWRVDIDAGLLERGEIDEVADFRALPAVWEGSYQAVVFDPPHITDTTDRAEGSSFNDSYGLGADGPRGENIVEFFLPFLHGAWRSLSDDGIVLAKLSNGVHGQRYQDIARSFKNLAEASNFTHCFDAIVVAENRGSFNDPKWQHVYHPRTIHSYWLVLRKGSRCYR